MPIVSQLDRHLTGTELRVPLPCTQSPSLIHKHSSTQQVPSIASLKYRSAECSRLAVETFPVQAHTESVNSASRAITVHALANFNILSPEKKVEVKRKNDEAVTMNNRVAIVRETSVTFSLFQVHSRRFRRARPENRAPRHSDDTRRTYDES